MNYLANNLLQQADAAEHQRQLLLKKALAYYDGDEPRDILKIKPGDPDDNVSVNYAETIVEKGVSFLFGQELGIKVGNEKDTTGETALAAVWPADQRAEDLVDLGTNGGIFGTAWLKLALDNGQPVVHVLDPLNMSVKWDADNYKLVRQFINQYNTLTDKGEPIIRRERTERQGNGFWKIFYEESKPDAKVWTEFAPPVNWNYRFAPVFFCKNLPKPNEFYGKSDLTPSTLSLIYYLARVDSLINKIVRVHASPKPVARGLSKQDLQVGVDQVLFLPRVEQDLKLLEATGDLAGAQAFRKQLREALAEVSHVPEVATGKLESIGQLSGLALKILYGPLLDRTIKKQRNYGRLITQVCRALLEMQGRKNEAISLHWPNPLPQDEKLEAEAKLAKKQIGFSQDTLIREMGGDPEHEAEMRKSEERELGGNLLTAFDQDQSGIAR